MAGKDMTGKETLEESAQMFSYEANSRLCRKYANLLEQIVEGGQEYDFPRETEPGYDSIGMALVYARAAYEMMDEGVEGKFKRAELGLSAGAENSFVRLADRLWGSGNGDLSDYQEDFKAAHEVMKAYIALKKSV